MKTKIKMIVGIAFLLISFNLSAQKQPKTITKTFKTSAICSMCKERIDAKLNYTKGIIYADLDVPTKMLTVKWKTKNISEAEIKDIISDTGYDIDDISANVESQKELPNCCQPNSKCEH
jgi:periplasmic mercuric ion binding protein